MRVWIDVTNSPHVPFFKPLVARLEADGHEVEVTAREYAQTLQLLINRRLRKDFLVLIENRVEDG